MKYSPTIKYLLDLVARASKLVLRDYNELCHMQGSTRSLDEFVKKSIAKSLDIIIEETKFQKKYEPNIQIGDKLHNINSKYTLIINPLDGVDNFTHAIPFFAISVALRNEDNGEIIASLVELPALREIYFAEKGNNAWYESYITSSGSGTRVRVAKRRDSKSMYFATNFASAEFDERSLKMNSLLISMCFFASGKLDACAFKDISFNDYQLASLIVIEAGGTIACSKNMTIFTNEESYPVMKHLI